MREIKFGGLDAHGIPRYGLLVKRDLSFDCWIRVFNHRPEPQRYVDYMVDPKTVSQYTGLKDRNGVEIYEGDILKYWRHVSGTVEIHVVKRFPTGAFKMDCSLSGETFKVPVSAIHDQSRVIGNIHQNPELIH